MRFNLTKLMRSAVPLAALFLGACLTGTNLDNQRTLGSSASISTTADTTAQSLTVGTAMTSFSPLTPSGGNAPYTYSYSGTLPTGLNLNTSTGAVTGTPTATYTTANVVFSVQDANGVVANTTSKVSFTVGAAGPITATSNTTAQSLTVGTAMTSFSPLTTSGGTAPYTFSVTSGTLPAGLSLSPGTGAVTGTPTTAQTAANVVFSVQDATGAVANTTSTVSFAVGAASASISATANTAAQSLTVGTAMTSFSPLAPSGGTAPYTYSYSGTLPAGLNFSTSTGAVTGNPTTAQTAANVVFSVQDAHGTVANTTSTVSFTVGAASASISATANTTAQNLTVGTAMTSFSPLAPSGGTAPYTYSYTGTLPTGLHFDTSTGAVTGTPTAAYSTANLVFSVQDVTGAVAITTSTVSFTAVAPASITATANTTAQSLTVGTAMASFTPLTVSGGTGPYTYSYSGTLPTGLSLNPSTGAVTGTPTARTFGPGDNAIFSVQDANGTVASTSSRVNFTVAPAPLAITATANTTAQNLTVGTAMSSFSPLSASGGPSPYTYSITSGTLPLGLSLNPSTGAVTGTPTTTQSASSVTFQVADSTPEVAVTTSTVSFTVSAAYVSEGGLTWAPVETSGPYTSASNYCAGTLGGLAGWRVPTKAELQALYLSGNMNNQGWVGLGQTWSSDSDIVGDHYYVDLFGGSNSEVRDGSIFYITCVR